MERPRQVRVGWVTCNNGDWRCITTSKLGAIEGGYRQGLLTTGKTVISVAPGVKGTWSMAVVVDAKSHLRVNMNDHPE